MKMIIIVLIVCFNNYKTFPQWFQLNSGITEHLYSVFFVDSITGYTVGNKGVILKTIDGGKNWLNQSTGITSDNYRDVYFTSEDAGYIVGYGSTGGIAKALIYKTTDGGVNWLEQLVIPNYGGFRSIYFIDENNGFTAGYYPSIYRTTNGGMNWVGQGSPWLNELYSIYFINANRGFIVGDFSTILNTYNGGISWGYQHIAPYAHHLRSIIFVNAVTGYITGTTSGGTYGKVFKTSNGGNDWVGQIVGENLILNSCFFTNLTTGYIVGTSGCIFKTTNEGINWVSQTSGTNNHLNSLFFIDDNVGYAVGHNGTILKTIDGGGIVPVELTSFKASYLNNIVHLKWSTASEINNYGFEIERSIDKSDWRIVGFKEGKGTTVETQTYSFTDDLFGNNVNILYYRLKQLDFNGSFEYSDIVEVLIAPTTFSLLQNYPNPFNPITTIKFSTPKTDLFQIKVYDILGNEIKTLLNEFKSPGNYEIIFDANDLPSGIYFYQLKAGEYTAVRKMILIK